MLLMSIATPATERKPPVPNSLGPPPRWMVEECSREFGQIAVLGLPFADPPTKDNMATKPSEANPIKPYGVDVKDAPAYWSQGILWTILATSEQTGGSYSLMEQLCPKDAGPPPHTHEQDEVIYVVEGELTMIAGAERINVQAGALAYILARCIHTFRVDSPEARLLNFYLPGGFEGVITELGAPAGSRVIPPSGLKQKGTPEQMKALFQKVGIREGARLSSVSMRSLPLKAQCAPPPPAQEAIEASCSKRFPETREPQTFRGRRDLPFLCSRHSGRPSPARTRHHWH